MTFNPSDFSYDVVLPSQILFNKNIEPSCIKLYAVIKGLARMHGYCYASNEYLSNILEYEERQIIRLIKSLESEGFVEVERYKEGFKSYRKIFLSDKFKNFLRDDKNDTVEVTKMSTNKKSTHIKEEYLLPPTSFKADPVQSSQSAIDDWKKKKISESWKEEEIEEALKRYREQPPGKIDNPVAWLNKVIESIRLKSTHSKMPQIQSEKGLELIKKVEGLPGVNSSGDIVTGRDYVHFTKLYDGLYKITDFSFEEKVMNALRKVYKNFDDRVRRARFNLNNGLTCT